MKKMRPLAILSFFFALTSGSCSVQAASSGFLGKLITGITLFAVQQTEGKWVNRYSTNFSGIDIHLGFDVAPLSNDECVCVGPYGNGSFVGEFDNDGDPVWGTHFSDVYLEHIIHNTNGDFLAAGLGFQDGDNITLPAPILMKFDIDEEDNEDYPFSFHWARTALFAFYADVNDIAQLEAPNSNEEYTIMVGTAWGAFTDNTSFTFSPRMFAFKYDGQGNVEWGGVASTPAMFDEAHSVVDEGNNELSISGWSAYNTGGGNFVPALSLVKMNHSSSEPSFLSTRLFLVGNDETDLASPLHGIVGLKHIRMSDGNYAFTGMYIAGENITSSDIMVNDTNTTISSNITSIIGNYTSSLFVGRTKKMNNGLDAPDWFEYIHTIDPIQSAGYGLAEHSNGNIMVIGAYEEDFNKTSTIVLELDYSDGQLERGRKYSEEGFGHNLGFSINVTKNGNVFGVGGITKNDSESIDVEMLLALWNKKLDHCGDKFEPNITLIPLILGKDIDPEDMEVPTLYAFGDAPDLDIESNFNTEKDRLCWDNDDDDYPWDLDLGEYIGVIIAYSVGAILICCTCCSIYLKAKCCFSCRQPFRCIVDPIWKVCKCCKPY